MQVALRNIRRTGVDAVKKLEKGDSPISEDESKSLQDEVMPPSMPLLLAAAAAGCYCCWLLLLLALTLLAYGPVSYAAFVLTM